MKSILGLGDFERSKAGGTFLIALFSLACFSLAGFHAFRWYVSADSWVATQGNFQNEVGGDTYRYHVPNLLGNDVQVRYSYKGKTFSVWTPFSRMQLDEIHAALLQPGRSTAPITLKVNPLSPEQAMGEPESLIWQILGLGFWMVIFALIWYLVSDKITALIPGFRKEPKG